MPLTAKGEEIMKAMKKQYPTEKKAKEVFYASANKGTITGVHDDCSSYLDAARRGDSAALARHHDAMTKPHRGLLGK